MKKLLVLMLSLTMVLCGSMAAGAFEAPKVTVGAGYLFGSASLSTGSDDPLEFADKGILFNADATVAGPWGVMVNYISLTGSNFESGGTDLDGMGIEDTTTRTDILATYAPSFGKGGLKFFAGYSTSEENLTTPPILLPLPVVEIKTTVKGPMVGGVLAAPVSEKVILSGFVGYGVGMTWEQTQDGVAAGDGDANLLAYRLAATYLVKPSVALEVGYVGNKYTLKEGAGSDDLTEEVNGFFAGARALF